MEFMLNILLSSSCTHDEEFMCYNEYFTMYWIVPHNYTKLDDVVTLVYTQPCELELDSSPPMATFLLLCIQNKTP